MRSHCVRRALPYWAATLLLCLTGAAHAQRALTFKRTFQTKLFIGKIDACGLRPSRVRPTVLITGDLMFAAFCKVTDASYGENPPRPNAPNPLDARIFGEVEVQWQCQANNPTPVSGSVTIKNAFGGPEIGPIFGRVNPIKTRNSIARDGTWSYVVSGHPDPVLEPSFTLFSNRAFGRANTDIWYKQTGKITCRTRGNKISAATALTPSYSQFPSHRLWTNRLPAPLLSVKQGSFNNLWSLAPVPAP